MLASILHAQLGKHAEHDWASILRVLANLRLRNVTVTCNRLGWINQCHVIQNKTIMIHIYTLSNAPEHIYTHVYVCISMILWLGFSNVKQLLFIYEFYPNFVHKTSKTSFAHRALPKRWWRRIRRIQIHWYWKKHWSLENLSSLFLVINWQLNWIYEDDGLATKERRATSYTTGRIVTAPEHNAFVMNQ